MHSSRMRTDRRLATYLRVGVRLAGGVSRQEIGVSGWGVSGQGGLVRPPSQKADPPGRQTRPGGRTPPVDRMTHACENITFPALLRNAGR